MAPKKNPEGKKGGKDGKDKAIKASGEVEPAAAPAPKKKQARRQHKDDKDHENAMAKFRYHLSRSKKEVRREYRKLTTMQKRDWQNKWVSVKNFDWVVTKKSESRSKKETTAKHGNWLSSDAIYSAEGWTEANSKSASGERAAKRAENIIAHCKKMGSKWMMTDIQSGDTLYKRCRYSDIEAKSREENIMTSLVKKSSADSAASQSESSASSSTSSSDDSDSEAEEKAKPKQSKGTKKDDPPKQDSPRPETNSNDNAQTSIMSNATALGNCAELEAKLTMFSMEKMPWVTPWSKQIEKMKDELIGARRIVLAVVQGQDDLEGMAKAMATISEARNLLDLLAPIRETMERATASIGQQPSATE